MQRYEEDLVAWAREQARHLRTGQFEWLDLEPLAEEIEDVGRSEQRALASRMAVLLAHSLQPEGGSFCTASQVVLSQTPAGPAGGPVERA